MIKGEVRKNAASACNAKVKKTKPPSHSHSFFFLKKKEMREERELW
jgi:hypothetical protein